MGWLSSPTPPTPPPAPTPKEIGAANVETAEHLSRLQRAMQFGEPMLRKGFREEGGVYYDSAGAEVSPSQAIEVDFTGRGDTDLARKEWEFQKEMSPLQAEFMLEQAREFGPQFTEEARALVEAGDPTGYAAREMAGEKAMAYEPEELPTGPVLEGLTDDLVLEADPEQMAARKQMEQNLITRLGAGDFSRRAGERAERIARGREAATGNIFGGGAIAQEARTIEEAEDAARRQGVGDYLAFLQSGQSSEDARTRMAQMNLQNELTGMASRNTASQQSYQNAMNRASGQEQLKQQQMANLQSFSGLAPVSSQFGAGAMAQQAAAANFMPTQYDATSGASLYGMNQGLAQSNYQGAMDAWQTQANIASQPSGFGQLMGGLGGAFLGSKSGSKLASGALQGAFGFLTGGPVGAVAGAASGAASPLNFGKGNWAGSM